MRTLFIPGLLVVLAGCATSHPIEPQVTAPSVDFRDAERVSVDLSNFKFNPETIRLRAGQRYALVVRDTAGGGHDFSAPEFFAAARIDPADVARVADGEIELKGGESITVKLIPAAGSYDLVCTHFGHAVLGMKGKIIVE